MSEIRKIIKDFLDFCDEKTFILTEWPSWCADDCFMHSMAEEDELIDRFLCTISEE